MLLLLFQFPSIFEPKEWPWPLWAVVVFAAFWFIKQLAEFVGSLSTLKNTGLSIGGWVKKVFTSAKVQAAKEMQELKATVTTLNDRFGTIENRTAVIEQQSCAVLAEVKPNGGTSLKDQVCGLVGSVENIVAREMHRDDTSSTPIFKLDAAGEMYYTNCAFRELVDAEDKDLHHLNYISRMEDLDQVAYTDMLNRSIAQKRPFDKAFHFKLTGPHVAVIRLQAIPDVRHGSKLMGFFGTAVKTTEEDIYRTAA